MVDPLSPEERSKHMAKIKGKNTSGERAVFSFLNKEHVYFQKHYKRAPGTPDIALPRKKKAIFVDSEFWHGKTYEKLTASREADNYWVIKIANNMKRDKRQRDQLIKDGWRILVVWEKDLIRKSTSLKTLKGVKEFLLND